MKTFDSCGEILYSEDGGQFKPDTGLRDAPFVGRIAVDPYRTYVARQIALLSGVSRPFVVDCINSLGIRPVKYRGRGKYYSASVAAMFRDYVGRKKHCTFSEFRQSDEFLCMLNMIDEETGQPNYFLFDTHVCQPDEEQIERALPPICMKNYERDAPAVTFDFDGSPDRTGGPKRLFDKAPARAEEESSEKSPDTSTEPLQDAKDVVKPCTCGVGGESGIRQRSEWYPIYVLSAVLACFLLILMMAVLDLNSELRGIRTDLDIIADAYGGQWVDAPVEGEHGWLGVTVVDGTAGDGKETLYGVVVVDIVSGSPAEDIGLNRGDMIYRVDDAYVASSDEFIDYLKTKAVGDRVHLYYIGRESGTVEETDAVLVGQDIINK